MSERNPSLPRDRRLLLVAAGVAGVLIGLLMLGQLSGNGDGDDTATGIPPRPGQAPQETTTVTTSAPPTEPAASAVAGLDPFAQLVTVPEAAQGGLATQTGQGAQAPQPPQAAGGSPAQVTQTTQTTRPADTTVAAQAQAQAPAPAPAPQPPPAAPASPLVATPTPSVLSGILGPVPVPSAPVQICINHVNHGAPSCMSTPAATSVSMSTFATVDPAATTPPTMVSGACSNGQGVAMVITTGSVGTTITGSVSVTVNGLPAAFPIGLPSAAPNSTVILSACVPPGVGGPALPGTGSPPLVSLVGGLLHTVLGLLVSLASR